MNKKTSRRLAAVALSLFLLGHAVAAAAAQAEKRFTDVKPGAWYETSVGWAFQHGIVAGYPDGTFRPNAPLTEAEFVTMLLKRAGIPIREKQPGEKWFAPIYEKATEMHYGVRAADAGKLQTRGKAAALIAASLGRTLDEEAAIRFLLDEGIAKGRSVGGRIDFAPNATMTRAEAVSFMQRAAEYAAKHPVADDPDSSGTENSAGKDGMQTGGSTNAGGGTGNSGSSSGGNSGDGGSPGAERPDSPPPSADNLAERTEQLAERIDELGLTVEKNGQVLSVSHPSGQGNGAILIPASDGVGSVQVLDDSEAGCLQSAHALLQYAGIAIDRTVFTNTLAAVKESGNNAALKIGSQLLTFQRTNTPGQITIQYAKY
ncbi:S-layer homology domain-containing protein [Cohnella caldifontis]|uniref:S-layer homology domain-containing protein n=1 Tax=Cohnella caldifontis TaxID=3027471 RepID=UPI0023EAFAD9|nr:S-layer homology domain-containing protein [Cohnella sp. YIM B05605]